MPPNLLKNGAFLRRMKIISTLNLNILPINTKEKWTVLRKNHSQHCTKERAFFNDSFGTDKNIILNAPSTYSKDIEDNIRPT